MKRHGVFSGIALACILGFLMLAAEGLLYYQFSSRTLLRGALVGSQLLYCIYLLRSIRPRIGAVTMVLLQAGMGLALFVLPVSDGWFLISWTVCLSLGRILLLRRSLATAGLDLATALAGIVFFNYLLVHSGSLAQAAWGFFLIQAGAGLIPQRMGGSATVETVSDDPFQTPLRQARSAIEELRKDPTGA